MDSGYKTLLKDHKEILAILRASRDSGSLSPDSPDAQDAIDKCRALHALLLDHFDREDNIIYNSLRDAALDDSNIHELLDQFDDDLLELTVAAKEFFAKCVPDNTQRMDHVRDYGTFYILLRDRFKREENILFKEYERLSGATGPS